MRSHRQGHYSSCAPCQVCEMVQQSTTIIFSLPSNHCSATVILGKCCFCHEVIVDAKSGRGCAMLTNKSTAIDVAYEPVPLGISYHPKRRAMLCPKRAVAMSFRNPDQTERRMTIFSSQKEEMIPEHLKTRPYSPCCLGRFFAACVGKSSSCPHHPRVD